MKTLKLVGAMSYSGKLVGTTVLAKGDTFDFEDKDVPRLLSEFSKDSANNEHPLFEEAKKVAAPAAARVARSRNKVQAVSA